MNIYIYRYGSICEPDVIESFKCLGFQVEEERTEITQKDLKPSDCVKFVAPKLIHGNYSFVFTINFFPWLSEICSITKTIYISLIVDSPVLELYSDAIKHEYNRIFLFDKELYNEFKDRNPGHIFHIPLAANMDRTDQVIASADESTKQRFRSDISFIGSTYQEKCPFNDIKLPESEQGYIDGIIEAQLKIYGYNFIEETISDEFIKTFLENNPDSFRFPDGYDHNYRALIAQYYVSVKVAEQERLRALKLLSDHFNVDFYTQSDVSSLPNIHNKGFARSLDEMPIIFHQSRINLNITAKSIRSGLSLRVFDVLGCGGFLITNYQAEIPEFFEIGKDLVTYDSFDDLVSKCQYYLTHEEERQRIALNGYHKVKQFHTYDVRLLQILNLAFPEI